MPYKHRADFDIDSFIAYEASVYGKMLLNDLIAAENRLGDVEDLGVMLKVLKELAPVSEELVPTDSLVREFIGGSSLKY